MWMQWSLRYGNPMFIPKGYYEEDDEVAKYDLRSQAYLLMRNLHQSYESIMTMSSEEREFYVKSELEFLEAQKKESEKIGKQNG